MVTVLHVRGEIHEIADATAEPVERLVTAHIGANEAMLLEIVNKKSSPTTSGAADRQNFK
jgi:hypothetical protein